MALERDEFEAIRALAARVLGDTARHAVERVPTGVSTRVYRIRRGSEIFYLRVLPEADASFAPEARVHELLRARGVRVPEVLYFEHCNSMLQRSVMLTSAIPGRPIDARLSGEALRRILNAAGRDLALINSIKVDGFGWIRRDQPATAELEGVEPSYRSFALGSIDEDLALLGEHQFSSAEIDSIQRIIERHDDWFDRTSARLAHGDFDATHIFELNGRYSGIIDFGEIRGAEPTYDLGHFHLHDGETISRRLLPDLLDGYREVATLTAEDERRLYLSSLLIGVRFLARQRRKRPGTQPHSALLASIRQATVLLASDHWPA